MSFLEASKKIIARKSIWDIEGSSVSERIQERRERIRKRMEAAKRMQRLLQMKKMMGVFKDTEEEAEIKEFVGPASLSAEAAISHVDTSSGEVVSNVKLSSHHTYGQHLDTTRYLLYRLRSSSDRSEILFSPRKKILARSTCVWKYRTGLLLAKLSHAAVSIPIKLHLHITSHLLHLTTFWTCLYLRKTAYILIIVTGVRDQFVNIKTETCLILGGETKNSRKC